MNIVSSPHLFFETNRPIYVQHKVSCRHLLTLYIHIFAIYTYYIYDLVYIVLSRYRKQAHTRACEKSFNRILNYLWIEDFIGKLTLFSRQNMCVVVHKIYTLLSNPYIQHYDYWLDVVHILFICTSHLFLSNAPA